MKRIPIVGKRDLEVYVHRKLKGAISKHHIRGVISILFDEMIKELRAGKMIKIAKFGKLILKKLPPRHYYDVRHQRVMTSPGHYIMRFFMAEPVRKQLCRFVDLDKIDPKTYGRGAR
jgi:nucleoid DNA-binding protein